MDETLWLFQFFILKDFEGPQRWGRNSVSLRKQQVAKSLALGGSIAVYRLDALIGERHFGEGQFECVPEGVPSRSTFWAGPATVLKVSLRPVFP